MESIFAKLLSDSDKFVSKTREGEPLSRRDRYDKPYIARGTPAAGSSSGTLSRHPNSLNHVPEVQSSQQGVSKGQTRPHLSPFWTESGSTQVLRCESMQAVNVLTGATYTGPETERHLQSTNVYSARIMRLIWTRLNDARITLAWPVGRESNVWRSKSWPGRPRV